MKILNCFYFILFFTFFASCSKSKVDLPLSYVKLDIDGRINDIYFVNENKGFAVGGSRFEEGYILKTEDGGQTWNKINENNINSSNNQLIQTLYGIDFYNESIGQIVGFGGKILRTEDGGENWDLIVNGTYSNFHAVAMQGEQKTFLAVFEGFQNGSVFSSTDFWYFFEKDTFPFALRDIHFIDQNIAIAAGHGTIQKSVDGGNSWNYLDIKGDYYYDISFPSNEIGFVCGWNGGVYKTTNQGETWKTLDLSNQAFSARQHYENIDFINTEKGAVCGYNGQVLLTQDGGKTWQIIKTETKDNFHSLRFLDENRLFVGGDNGILLEISVP